MGIEEWAELEWRRKLKLRGAMPIEIARGGEILGHLRPVKAGFASAVFEASWQSASWEFRRRGVFGPWLCEARDNPTALPVVRQARTGFRRSRIELRHGPTLHWRQRGLTGSRYELTSPGGEPCLEVRNNGGPLRWHGTILVLAAGRELSEYLSLLILFSVFLALNSSEIDL